MPEKLNVKITIKSDGTCQPEPFAAKPGSIVTFTFDKFPNADIIFEGGASPFASPTIKPGSHRVRADVAPESKFKYKVVWPPQGQGNGSGTVIGG